MSASNTVRSDQTINLNFASGFPPENPRELINIKWIEKIQNETDQRVKIIPLYEKNVFEVKESHNSTVPFYWQGWQALFKRADITITSAVIPGAPLPISLSLKYFVYGADLPGVRHVFETLWEEFPDLRAEYSNCMRLAAHLEPEFWVLSKKPVRTISDFKGLKLSGVMGEFADLINRLGAKVARLDNPGKLGTSDVDGLIFIREVLMIYNCAEEIPYATNLHTCNPPLDTFVMNLKIWNSLPPDIQKVFEKSKTWLESELDKVVLGVDRKAADFAIARGQTTIELSHQDLSRVFDFMNEIALVKAQALDAQGLPGTKIFRETRRLVEDYNRAR